MARATPRGCAIPTATAAGSNLPKLVGVTHERRKIEKKEGELILL